jgi:mono/diheme cytochrome c family protein
MRRAKSIMMVISCTPAIFAAPAVTSHKDIESLLQSRCQSCHRPGEIGPMPLMNYQQVRPWAAAIREAVLSKKMPPWFADGRAHQQYNDDPSLTGAELATIENWVASGAPEGNLKDAPAPRQFVGG